VKNHTLLLSFAILLLASSCKKDNPTIKTPEVLTVKRSVNDSVSFVVDGKLYTSNSISGDFSNSLYGNSGTNLKLSDKPGDWSISGPDYKYWVGAADSVQYYSGCRMRTNDFSAAFWFIKNYKRADIMKRGTFYVPNTTEKYYAIKNYSYATDFGREGKYDGVALSWGNYEIGGSSFSSLSINEKSKLTADSQNGSNFKITKIEEVQGTDYVILEATFEVNLYNEKEEPIKVTKGFLRLRTLKYGNRF
jgi:hypothetical protein